MALQVGPLPCGAALPCCCLTPRLQLTAMQGSPQSDSWSYHSNHVPHCLGRRRLLLGGQAGDQVCSDRCMERGYVSEDRVRQDRT